MANPLRALPGALLLTAIAACVPIALDASEITATHLVYEKATKMKKAAAVLYLPFFDQSLKSDSPRRGRAIDCMALADGKGGSLPVQGKFLLRILGESGGASSAWKSNTLSATLDDSGEASFTSDEILGLVDDAAAVDARLDMFEIEFDGGRGKKIRTLTVDCIHREVE